MNSKERLHTELKSGLTTGTCASAVAKASAWMLVNQRVIDHVMVKLPVGKEVVLELIEVQLNKYFAQCTTIKDAGDDPDVTHGAEIVAKAKITSGNEVNISAGKGIGMVTKPGLAVEVGKPAINPVPFQMIQESVQEVIPTDMGIHVEISVPRGKELASKTFNPKLGIEGGISILGTTGIVKPMSEEALKDSLVIKLKQLQALGKTMAVFSPGNYGKAFSKENFSYDEECIVLTSNYIGFMLEQAVRYGFNKLVLIGHIGKLVKLAGRIFQTHSRTADARNEILAAHYFSFTKDEEGFQRILTANTMEEVAMFVDNDAFWNYLSANIKQKAEAYIYKELTVEVVLFSQQKGLLAHTPKALELMKDISNE